MITPASGLVTGIVGNHCGFDDTHGGIDIARTAGGPIYAAAAGTVTTRIIDSGDVGYGTHVIIEHPNGYRTLYGHMVADSSKVIPAGATVQKGQQIGLMGTTGESTGVHLHFEVQINELTQDGINGFFPCDSTTTAQTPIQWDFPNFAANTGAYERVGVLKPNGDLKVKDGITGPWITVANGVTDFALAGGRIGVVTTDGDALVKEGALNAPWTVVDLNATDIELSGDRIGVTRTSGVLRVKQGAVDAGWVENVATNVREFDLAGTRIAVRDSAGAISVKEGPINSGWIQVGTGTQVSITETRIGIVLAGDTARVKEGPINAGWTEVATAAREIVLSGDRIAVRGPGGRLRVKEGAVNAGWTEVDSAGVSSVALSGYKIGRVDGGSASVKNGAVNAGWTNIDINTTRIVITG